MFHWTKVFFYISLLSTIRGLYYLIQINNTGKSGTVSKYAEQYIQLHLAESLNSTACCHLSGLSQSITYKYTDLPSVPVQYLSQDAMDPICWANEYGSVRNQPWTPWNHILNYSVTHISFIY